jgi:hypothetical protein
MAISGVGLRQLKDPVVTRVFGTISNAQFKRIKHDATQVTVTHPFD